MKNIIELVAGSIAEKKEWYAIERRSRKLPKEYQVVYEEIKKYLWSGSGVITMNPMRTMVELFEESAANGKAVLDVTGNDVAAFCDELVKGEKSYFDGLRGKLNSNITKKLG